MKRIIVAGGAGFFGSEIVRLLRDEGIESLAMSRRSGLDVENRASVEAQIEPGDLVIDTAGPFQRRSTTLIEAAIEIGFDVIDLSDSADYARAVIALEPRIAASGVRVFTSCSSVSTISALAVMQSGIAAPTSIVTYLAPASRHTANRATVESLVESLRRVRPERETLDFPEPIGRASAWRLESADEILLPRIWPTIRSVEFYVTPNIVGGRLLLGLARYWVPLPLLPLARALGSRVGCYGVEVRDGSRAKRFIFIGRDRSHLIAVLPSVLAASSIARDGFPERGLVPPTRHVDPQQLLDALAKRALWSAAL